MFIKKILYLLKKTGIKNTYKQVIKKIRLYFLVKTYSPTTQMQNAWNNRYDYFLDPMAFGVSPEVHKEQQKYQFNRNIKFSILVPLYNTPKDFLQEMIASVLFQSYQNWELCLADGSDSEHDYVKEICQEISGNEPRIKYRKLEKNEGISANTNKCLEMANGDYICLFDHDDLLHPSALFETMKVICEKNADFVYTDEATFLFSNLHKIISVHFKPEFSQTLLESNNYICHFSSFRKELLSSKILFDSETDGAQDFDLFLKISEKTTKIFHINKVLYYWRATSSSTALNSEAKSYTSDSGRKALENHFTRLNEDVQILNDIKKDRIAACPF